MRAAKRNSINFCLLIITCILILGCTQEKCSDSDLTFIKNVNIDRDTIVVYFKKIHVYTFDSSESSEPRFTLEAHNSFSKEISLGEIFSEFKIVGDERSWPLSLEKDDSGIISKSSNRFYRLELKYNYIPFYLDSLNQSLQNDINDYKLFGILRDGNLSISIEKASDFRLCVN